MKVKAWNLHAHELIGLYVYVMDRKTGVSVFHGRVVDETRYTLVIEFNGTRKRFLKRSWIFRFMLPSKVYVEVSGDRLVGRPEERVKKL